MISRLGVVDQSPVSVGSSPAQALQNSIDLAQQCERLGYHRYWVAEHHSSAALAGSAPEILVGQIAGATSAIRVGAGGVMLTHYSSYKVAEQWRMLHAFFPHRIDLGLGRAPGSDRTTAAALAKGPGALSAEHYPAQVTELAAFLRDEPDPSGPFRDVRATPTTDGAPSLWLLASSAGSASIAAHLGMPLVWAHFIAREPGQPIVDAYRANYRPSADYPHPIVMLATTAICADTEQEAAFVASSVQRWRASGPTGPIPEPAPPGTPLEGSDNPLFINQRVDKPLLHGSPAYVKDELETLATSFGTDEVLLVTITHDHAARVRSYELIADAFGLSALEGAATQASTVTAG